MHSAHISKLVCPFLTQKDRLKRKGAVVEMRKVPLFQTEELLERIFSDGSVISGLRYYVLITMAGTKGKKGKNILKGRRLHWPLVSLENKWCVGPWMRNTAMSWVDREWAALLLHLWRECLHCYTSVLTGFFKSQIKPQENMDAAQHKCCTSQIRNK